MSLKTLWEQMAGVQLANYGTRFQRPVIDGQSLALGWNPALGFNPDPNLRTVLSFMDRRGVRALTGLQRSDGQSIGLHGPGSSPYNSVQATGEAAALATSHMPIDFLFSIALDAWRKSLGLQLSRLIVGFNGIAGQSIVEFDRSPGGTLGNLIRDNHLRAYQEAKRIAPAIEALFYGMIQGEADVSMTRDQYYAASSIAYDAALADITAQFGTTPPLMLWQTGGYVDSAANPYGPPLAQADQIRDRNGVMAGPIYPFHLSDQVHPYHEPSIIMAEMGAYVWAKHEQGVNLSMLYGTPTVMGNQVIIPVEGLEPGKSLTFDPVDKYAAYGGLTNRGVEVIGNTVTNVELSGANITVTASSAIAGQRFQIAMQSADMSSFVDANGRNYAAHRCDIMESAPVDSKILPGTPVKRFVLSGQWDPGAYEVGEDPIDTSAQRVIVLTDYAGDCDDAAALAVACKAHEDGDINILGFVATSSVATSAAGVYGQLLAYGQEAIPVYAYQGAIGTYNNRISAPVRDAHGIPGQTRTAFPDDVVGLRTMLAAAPNASVKMIDVGAPISTSRLLDSPADAISPMTGRELVEAKVVGLWMMAGEFTSTRVEYNADRDVASTQNVYQTWPTPVYAHGAEVGGTILTAPGPGTASGVDPVKTAFDAFDVASPTSLEVYLGRRARSSWDPACVHHAIYGNQSFYNYAGANGTITVSATGVTTWSATPAGNRFQVGKAASDATIAADIQAMIDAFAIVVPAELQVMSFALNEGTGTAVTSEQGDAGTAVNTTWGTAPTRLNFNGTSSYLSLGRPSAANDLSDFIVAAIVRFNSVSGTPVLFSRNGTDGVGKQFFFRVNNGLLQYVPFQAKAAEVIDGSTVAANQWGMLLAFCRPSAVTIRQNGVTTAADAPHFTMNSNPEVRAAPYVMGARYSLSGGNYIYRDFFNGSIAASEIVHGATAADIPAVEQRLRDIATVKGITLP